MGVNVIFISSVNEKHNRLMYIILLFQLQSRLVIETKILLMCIGKQPKVNGFPYTRLLVLSEHVEFNEDRVLFINDIDEEEEEKLEPRGDAIDSESELQSNLDTTSKSSRKQYSCKGFLLLTTLFLQNHIFDIVEADLLSKMHGFGSPKLRIAGGGVSGGSSSFGDSSFATPGCISHLNGTPSPLL